MKFIIDNWVLIFSALTSGGFLLWPLISKSGGNKVTAAEAVTLINREKAVLIDVSEPTEYAQGHAAGAKNIPFSTIEGSKALPKNKALPLVLLCPTGARAARAAAAFKKLGFEKTLCLAGGTPSWREANLPVEKSA